ncbi:hypothetical protein PAXRUDRAFT_825207 [Paxillus rubicundulus Ve08.2h10]|uniref:Uncharacterized protein n=1 Tax=Paxillus rubicundulus Ve08.2h10 TaxID=930991 RepID=A0A0D0E6L6_9AGAM|nr:hypothetical protein PAXRUDRAFT_825207 [Paxillus rubicundulus Ve08.2h10]
MACHTVSQQLLLEARNNALSLTLKPMSTAVWLSDQTLDEKAMMGTLGSLGISAQPIPDPQQLFVRAKLMGPSSSGLSAFQPRKRLLTNDVFTPTMKMKERKNHQMEADGSPSFAPSEA